MQRNESLFFTLSLQWAKEKLSRSGYHHIYNAIDLNARVRFGLKTNWDDLNLGRIDDDML